MRTVLQLRKVFKESDPSVELLNEAYRRCKKDSTNIADAILQYVQPTAQQTAWCTLAMDHPEPVEAGSGRWFPEDQSAKDFERQVVEMVDSTHYFAKDGSEFYLYPVEDRSLKIVGRGVGLNNPTTSDLGIIGAQWRRTLAGEQHKIASTKWVKVALDTFLLANGLTETPAPDLYAQPENPCGWAYARRTIDADATVAFPNIGRLLAAMNDGEAFAAKLYAIAYGLDTSRQALYVRGEGKDGKSSFLKAFVRVLGERVTKAITGVHVSQSSKFLAAEYKDCALVYSPDNQNPSILLTEVVKSITGDDKVSYEKKYGGFGEYNSRAKLVIFSNHRPNVLAERHSLSRILYIEMSKPEYQDVGVEAFSAACWAEMPGFLAYGAECYARRWADNMIELNDAAQEALESLVASTSFDWDVFVGQHLVFDEDGELLPDELAAIFDGLKMSKLDQRDYRQKLSSLASLVPMSATDRRRVYRGVRRKAPSDLTARGGRDDA